MGFSEFLFETKKGKKMMGMLYGFGASIVIVGALFKIMHWPGAGIMLTVGLLTEAVIFAFSAFEPPHMEVDWSLVYPELAGMDEEMDLLMEEESDDKGSITEQLDHMLEDARIGPELIESLGTGLRSLADNASKISDVSGAAASTSEYTESLQEASSRVKELSDSYVKASENLNALVVSEEEGTEYSNNFRNITKNLSALNSVYELQLQTVNEHMQNTSQAYEGIGQLIDSLSSSIEGTQQYKENISKLASNLTSLNTVYGNMLTAMNVSPQ
ncbi:MAG: gliding motility protein GldL [Vicingaceae bacterium]